jgi:acyl-CoA thioesterase-1
MPKLPTLHVLPRLIGLIGSTLAVEAAPSTAEPRTILFFGDSLTAGHGLADPSTAAYPAVIQGKIDDAGLPWRVVNAGLSGETTSGGLRHVDWILRQPADVFVLALGANDGLRGISPKYAGDNLAEILGRVQARNPQAKLVLAGMQMPTGMGAEFARDFASIYPRVAAEAGAVLIPHLLEGVGGKPSLNQHDRIHPTAEGHAIMAETVWAVLQPLLEETGEAKPKKRRD